MMARMRAGGVSRHRAGPTYNGQYEGAQDVLQRAPGDGRDPEASCHALKSSAAELTRAAGDEVIRTALSATWPFTDFTRICEAIFRQGRLKK